MALSTYSDLKTAIANFANRSDLTTNIDDFIDLTEARLNREIFSRFENQRVTANTTANDPFVSLPTPALPRASPQSLRAPVRAHPRPRQ